MLVSFGWNQRRGCKEVLSNSAQLVFQESEQVGKHEDRCGIVKLVKGKHTELSIQNE